MRVNSMNDSMKVRDQAPSGLLVGSMSVVIILGLIVYRNATYVIAADPVPAVLFAGILLSLIYAFSWQRLGTHSLKKPLAQLHVATVWSLALCDIVATAPFFQRMFVNYLPAVAAIGLGIITLIALGFIAIWWRQQGKVAGYALRINVVLSTLAVILFVAGEYGLNGFTQLNSFGGEIKLSAKAKGVLDRPHVVRADEEEAAMKGDEESSGSLDSAFETVHTSEVHTKRPDQAMIHGGQASGHSASHWSYIGEEGPQFWARLQPDYALCRSGLRQSPIDIQKSWKLAKNGVQPRYNPGPMQVVNNGHTIQSNFASGSKLALLGVDYQLKQMHFHAPSEHLINGVIYPLELHFVHAKDSGELAVLGVLVESGSQNAELEKFIRNAPQRKGKEQVSAGHNFDPRRLLPRQPAVYQYLGSLTTPPCSEGVKWSVFKEPIQASQEQIARLKMLYPNNSRPVQDLNNRVVGAFSLEKD